MYLVACPYPSITHLFIGGGDLVSQLSVSQAGLFNIHTNTDGDFLIGKITRFITYIESINKQYHEVSKKIVATDTPYLSLYLPTQYACTSIHMISSSYLHF